MPDVKLNNRSDRRVAQRLDAKRESKREKKLMKSSPNASKYNAKKSRKKGAKKSQIAATTPIASVKPRPITPSSMAMKSLVYQHSVKESSDPEYDSSSATEENSAVDTATKEEPVVESLIIAALKEDLAMETISSITTEEENAVIGEKPLVKTSEDAITKEKLVDKSLIFSSPKEDLVAESLITTVPKEEHVMESISSQEIDNVNHQQDDSSQDKNITAKQEKTQSNELVGSIIQKVAHTSEKDTIQNKEADKELPSTQQFVFPPTAVTNNPVPLSGPTPVSSTKKKNIISRLYKKSVKACDEFITEKIQSIGKVNRIGIVLNESTKPNVSWKKFLKK
ncbi:hypothetical protein INT47_003346 [Mucor saturninus]|uniref:Uncharacterized protein n=1 Tax=Mucor saturninus TaxID=64648 RepID=A0A8H7RIN8_9FUNG|nr:hypothetical protein INT47_003346 [Mucor saturninus]